MSLLESFDIIGYLESRNLDIVYSGKNVSSSGEWATTNCPFCLDQSNHLGVNLFSKAFVCFRCGEKGNALKLVEKIESCSKSASWKIVREFQSIDSIYEEKEIIRSSRVEFPEGVNKDFTEDHKEYLRGRNFDPDFLIKKYSLYAGQRYGFFKYRIVVPVILDNQIVTLVGRDYTGLADVPYKNLPAEQSKLTTKEALYNIDSVKDKAIVVEGVFDVWRIGDGAVAVFGVKTTDKQVLLLKGIKVFVMFDADAKKEGHKLAQSLYGIASHVEEIELEKGDPCDLSIEEVLSLRKEIGI